MAESDEEEIFQINDYTQYTEFEAFTSSIELYMRHNGFSVDIRTTRGTPISNRFDFRDKEILCEKKGSKPQSSTGMEPLCIAEMWEENPTFYPFLGSSPSQWFGFSEFLLISGDEIDDSDEKIILSAFAVGAQNAKCPLPVFRMNEDNKGMKDMTATGLLMFPGVYATFEVWNLGKKWKTEPKLSFLRGFPGLLRFFETKVAPHSLSVRAAAYVAYRIKKDQSQLFDVIDELHLYCRWAIRPAAALSECIRGHNFDILQCDGYRVRLKLSKNCGTASEYVEQLSNRSNEGQSQLQIGKLKESISEALYFDEFLLMLSELFPMFPINSFWTKVTIDLLFDSNTFSKQTIKALGDHMGRIAETGLVKVNLHNDFKHYSRFAELNQHALIILASFQCREKMMQTDSLDINSRSVFLHQSPFRAREQRLIPSDVVKPYQDRMLARILKAYCVDKFTEKGIMPSPSDFIEWHKTAITEFDYYKELCSQMDDGEILGLWKQVTAMSFLQTSAYIADELMKEMETSMDALKGLSLEEISKFMPGLCVSSIIALTFRRQVALYNLLKPVHLVIPEIKELIRPSFREFRRYCKHLPNFRTMDSVVIEEVRNELSKLENAISKAFSLSIHFANSRGLTSKLMKSLEVDVSEDADRTSVLEYIKKLGESGLWKSQTVLLTDDTRLSCTWDTRDTHLAIVRVVQERPSE